MQNGQKSVWCVHVKQEFGVIGVAEDGAQGSLTLSDQTHHRCHHQQQHSHECPWEPDRP